MRKVMVRIAFAAALAAAGAGPAAAGSGSAHEAADTGPDQSAAGVESRTDRSPADMGTGSGSAAARDPDRRAGTAPRVRSEARDGPPAADSAARDRESRTDGWQPGYRTSMIDNKPDI